MVGGPCRLHTDTGVKEGPQGKVGPGRCSELDVGVSCGGGGPPGDDEGSAQVGDLDEAEGPSGGRGSEKELTLVTGGAAAGGSPHGRAVGKLGTSGFGMYGAGCCGDERPDVRGGPRHI